MKILFAASPIIGHVNPLLTAARLLQEAGHETAMLTGSRFGAKVEAAGVRFFALPADVDIDMADIAAKFPEWAHYVPGPEQMLFGMKAIMADAIPSQSRRLDDILLDFPADLVVHETTFLGILPLLLRQRASRPASACIGITSLTLTRTDGAPYGPGLLPAVDQAQREQYRMIAQGIEAMMITPMWQHTDQVLRKLDVQGLPVAPFEATAMLADVILQPCVADFDYPLYDTAADKLHFIGALMPQGAGEVPARLQQARAEGRRIVLVSQGTIANHDLGQLLGPAIGALGAREDILIVATTGGKPLDSLPFAVPANTVVSPFLNFSEILPQTDLLIALGGYGTVTQALHFGVPMVLAGLGEDKPEIAARVTWSGCGIYLPTDRPGVEQLGDAVDQVLSQASYRARAQELAAQFAGLDARRELPRRLEDLFAASRERRS
jgi:MGT family glycosyltransferase